MSGFYKAAAAMAVLLLLGGCASSGELSSASMTGVANPLKSYESIEAMAQAVEFDFLIPEEMPEQYSVAGCYTVSGQVVSVKYTDGGQEVLYRTAPDTGEYDRETGISGNYTAFANRETVQVGDYEVIFAYDTDDAPCLALWGDGTMLYSLDGLPVEETEQCILSLSETDF